MASSNLYYIRNRNKILQKSKLYNIENKNKVTNYQKNYRLGKKEGIYPIDRLTKIGIQPKKIIIDFS
jgi:hypothetical protein